MLLDSKVAVHFLSHVGYVTKDVDKTVEFLSSIWGLGPWQTVLLSPPEDRVLAGEPFSLKIKWARLWGPVVLEVLQPLSEGSVWSNFVETRGEGIQHIAVSVSNWEEVVSQLREQGGRMLTGSIAEGKRWCYMDVEPRGVILELMEDGLHDMVFPNTY